MARHNAALSVTQGGLNVGKLAVLCGSPHLQHGLCQSKHGAGIARVAVGQHAAMRIEWFRSPWARHTAGEKLASLSFTAEPKVFELN